VGLPGGGGSILAVPVLVYGFGLAATQATGYSLLIVGVASLLGAWANWRRGLVSVRITAFFALPSMASVYLTRAYLVPALPQRIFLLPGVSMGRDRLLMVAFAALMAVTAVAMIRGRRDSAQDGEESRESCFCGPLMAEGLAVGAIAGLFGAGGGFLIIPALVLLAHLPMRRAVGTSLAIISVQSLFGFVGAVQASSGTDWRLLAEVTLIAIAGMGLGLLVGPRLQAGTLRTAFGWFVLLMGAGIGVRELFS
jgi:uncharacterized membrane protein YfcA